MIDNDTFFAACGCKETNTEKCRRLITWARDNFPTKNDARSDSVADEEIFFGLVLEIATVCRNVIDNSSVMPTGLMTYAKTCLERNQVESMFFSIREIPFFKVDVSRLSCLHHCLNIIENYLKVTKCGSC